MQSSYRYADNPPIKLLLSVVIQALVIAFVNFAFLVLLLKSAHLSPERLVAHQQWLMVAFFVTNFIQCLRFTRLGAGLFMPATSPAIYLVPALIAIKVGGIPLMIGMMLFASACEFGLSFCIQRIRRFFPQEITGLAFMIVGIQICIAGFHFAIDAYPSLARVIFLFAILAVIVVFSVWAKGILRNLTALYGVVLGLLLLYFFPHWLHFTSGSINLSVFS